MGFQAIMLNQKKQIQSHAKKLRKTYPDRTYNQLRTLACQAKGYRHHGEFDSKYKKYKTALRSEVSFSQMLLSIRKNRVNGRPELVIARANSISNTMKIPVALQLMKLNRKVQLFSSMSNKKGSRGTPKPRPNNGPSTTGKPSGNRRGNNPPKK